MMKLRRHHSKGTMSLQDKLNQEVEEYNQLIDQLTNLEKDRASRMGRIQVLTELVQEEAKKNAKEASAKADKEAAKSEPKSVKTSKAEG